MIMPSRPIYYTFETDKDGKIILKHGVPSDGPDSEKEIRELENCLNGTFDHIKDEMKKKQNMQ